MNELLQRVFLTQTELSILSERIRELEAEKEQLLERVRTAESKIAQLESELKVETKKKADAKVRIYIITASAPGVAEFQFRILQNSNSAHLWSAAQVGERT